MNGAESLGLVDLGALVLLAVFAVLGGVKGAVRLIIGLLALGAGVVLAGRYGGELRAETWPVIKGFDDPERVGRLVGCGLIFVAALLAGALLARLLRKAITETNLGGMDRLVGLLLGLAQGALWVAVVVTGLKALGLPQLDAELEDSAALAGTRDLVLETRGLASPEVRAFLDATLELPAADG